MISSINSETSFLSEDVFKENKKFSKLLNKYKQNLNKIYSFDHTNLDEMRDAEESFYNRLNFILKNQKGNKSVKIAKIIISLGATYYFTKKRKNSVDKLHYLYNHHFSLIQKSMKAKIEDNNNEILENLKNKRLPDVNDEYHRLIQNKRIENSIKKIEKHKKLKIEEKVAIAQSIELREELKEHYYIINHGQNLPIVITNILATQLKNAFEPRQYENYAVLRHEVFLKNLNPKVQDVEWFCKKLIVELDSDFQSSLVCGDLLLESTEFGESALHFFTSRHNKISDDKKLSHYLVNQILAYYFPDSQKRKILSDKIINLIPDDVQGGALYSICIPKSRFHEMGFLSKAFGKPIKKTNYSAAQLDLLQNGIRPSDDISLFNGHKEVPQVRLLSHMLNPKKVFIIPHLTLEPARVQKIENQVKLLIQEEMMRKTGS